MAASQDSARRTEKAAFPAITVGYDLDGSPRGVPVVLLHGFPDTTATWDRVVVEFLPVDDLWVIRPHIRGHGPTRMAPGHPVSAATSALAADVCMLADHLGIASFHLVGSDWGCRAAYALAGLWPHRVRSVVTLGTGYNEATPIGELSLDQVTSFWYHTVLHYYRYRWGSAAVTETYRAPQAIVEAMPDIVVPTTHIQGLEDHCTRPETATRWATRVAADYRHVELAGVGHFPQREAPGRGAAEMLRTIRSAER